MDKLKLATIFTISLFLLAGCLGGLTSYEAYPAEVNENIAEENGYEITQQESIEFNESIQIANETQSAEVTSWITVYESTETIDGLDIESPAVYATLSTPSVEIIGQELNPILLDPRESTIDQFEDLEQAGVSIESKIDSYNETNVETEEDMRIEQYEATFDVPEMSGEVDGYVLLSTIETENAIVLTVGGYPEMLEEEKEVLLEMMTETEPVHGVTDDE